MTTIGFDERRFARDAAVAVLRSRGYRVEPGEVAGRYVLDVQHDDSDLRPADLVLLVDPDAHIEHPVTAIP